MCSANSVLAESLSDVYALSLQNDYKLRAAQSAYLAGQESVTIARAGLLPKLNAAGVWTRSETTSSVESSNPFAPVSKNIADSNAPGYTISLNQPLIDFVALHNYRRGEISVRLAALQLESAKQALIIRTADLYLQTLTAGAKFAAAQSAEDAFRLQLKAAKLKYDIGMARISHYLEAQAALDASVADTVVAKNNLNVQFDFLRVSTGQYHAELMALPENFSANLPMPTDFQEWIKASRKNNVDLNIAKLKVDDAYQNAQSKAAEHMPKLVAGLSYSDSNDHRTYNTAIPDRLSQHGLSVSLSLSMPLYSGGAISASAREANYHYLEQRDNSDGINREVEQKTHSIYLSVVAGVAAVNARKAAIISSQSALEFAQKGYEEGVIDMLNVLDAQKNVYQAKQSYADAIYAYLIAGLRLKEVAGSIGASDIGELSRQLDDYKKVYRPSLN
jgi:outer membrane protein